jgi:uncharacterized DUF497 family protein
MLEWDEAKRLKNIKRRSLDFEDDDLMFDGRPVTTAASRRNNEGRFVSTAEISGKLYTVVWMWRGENQLSARPAAVIKRASMRCCVPTSSGRGTNEPAGSVGLKAFPLYARSDRTIELPYSHPKVPAVGSVGNGQGGGTREKHFAADFVRKQRAVLDFAAAGLLRRHASRGRIARGGGAALPVRGRLRPRGQGRGLT